MEADVRPVSGTKDFFISYNRSDRGWAEWIADVLEKASYSVTIQAWDFPPGSNFVVEMQKATSECERTIAVLSPDYLASMFTQAEWAVAFSIDPSGAERKLIPMRVRICKPPGLLHTIVYCDLVELAEDAAKAAVLSAVIPGRARRERPPFPNSKSVLPPPLLNPPVSTDASYPGVTSQVSLGGVSPSVRAAVELLSFMRTTRTAFEAQCRLRDKLVRDVMERLVLNPRGLKYEEFLAEYVSALTAKEMRTFRIIRGFTESVLFEYNSKVLHLLEDTPSLAGPIHSVKALRDHLTLWLVKYHAVFVNDLTMALIYVGIDEGVPYPENVERETWRYLESKGEVESLLGAEEPPEMAFGEGPPYQGHWLTDQLKRWQKKEFMGITAEIAALDSAEALEELDTLLVTIISDVWYPSCIWLKTNAPIDQMIESTRSIVSLSSKLSGTTETGIIDRAREALGLSGPFIFRSLLPLFPRLIRLNRSLGSPTQLDDEWILARGELIKWGTRYFDDTK